jgi:hypothetical protein
MEQFYERENMHPPPHTPAYRPVHLLHPFSQQIHFNIIQRYKDACLIRSDGDSLIFEWRWFLTKNYTCIR